MEKKNVFSEKYNFTSLVQKYYLPLYLRGDVLGTQRVPTKILSQERINESVDRSKKMHEIYNLLVEGADDGWAEIHEDFEHVIVPKSEIFTSGESYSLAKVFEYMGKNNLLTGFISSAFVYALNHSAVDLYDNKQYVTMFMHEPIVLGHKEVGFLSVKSHPRNAQARISPHVFQPGVDDESLSFSAESSLVSHFAFLKKK